MTIPDKAFVELFEKHGATHTAEILKQNPRTVYRRRERIEQRIKRHLLSPNEGNINRHGIPHPHRLCFDVSDGVVLVGSDCHIWPGDASLSFRTLVRFCKELRPKVVVLNGDVIDACTISRHPPIGWEDQPTVQQEIETAQEQLHQIELATARHCKLAWTLGNHDSRFETRLATVAPEYARVRGVHLRDHFPAFSPAWSVWVNHDVVIKHRFKGGIHAPHNNTMWAGKTLITGHLHSAKVIPFSDYNGTRYGVDTGCMADPYGPQFTDYMEDNPRNWREGFAVLTFKNGKLMMPELCTRFDEKHMQFRGMLV